MSIGPFFRKPAWRGVWLGLACALAAWGLSRTPPLIGLEDWMLDGCFFFRGTRATQARVVLVGLDESSLNQLSKPLAHLSPELAEVVAYAHRQGAAAIGVDLLVPEAIHQQAEINTPGAAGDAWKMGQAVMRARNVVLPQRWVEDGWLRPAPQWRLKQRADPEPIDLGFTDLQEDGDQIIRRQHFLDIDGGQPLPQFALALFCRARGETFTWNDERGELRLGGERVPLDPDQTLRINFVGPPQTFPALSFGKVLEAAREGQPAPELKNAVVLIGLTARGQQDYHATPFANNYARYLSGPTPGLMSGTELQAHILATLWDRAYVTTPWWLSPLPWLLVFGIGLGVSLARVHLGAGLFVVVLHHFFWKGVALAAFSYAHWRVEVVAMLLLGFFVYSATFAFRWRVLRRMFGVVKSQAVALALETDPHRLDPGGEERTVTVLFADIRSFTDFSEKHSARQVVDLLNAYFAAVVPLIEAEGGTLNTYMGDGVMVLFNAPASLPDHALRAARAAVAMVRKVHDLRTVWARLDRERVWRGQGGMRIGVGVHTGKVVVGAIGSPQRLDYTAIGDVVNAAARIESENKTFGTEVLISAETRALISEQERASLHLADEPFEAHVKGRTEKLLLYAAAVP